MKQSEQTNEVYKALVKARTQLKQPMKDANNPFFKSKYVPLEAVVEAVEKACEGTGLSFMQDVSDNQMFTVIFHESGQYVSLGGSELKPVKNDPQALGSAMTYARRYSLSTAFGITSDIDDDGNATMSQPKAQSRKPAPRKPAPKPVITKTALQAKVDAGEVTSAEANLMVKAGKVDLTK